MLSESCLTVVSEILSNCSDDHIESRLLLVVGTWHCSQPSPPPHCKAAGLHICQRSHTQQHTGRNSAKTLSPLLHSGSRMLDYEILVSIRANFHILLEVLVTMNVPGIRPPHCTLIFYFQKFYRRSLCLKGSCSMINSRIIRFDNNCQPQENVNVRNLLRNIGFLENKSNDKCVHMNCAIR